MERDVTVSVRSLVLAGVVLLALLAGWVLGGGTRGGTPARAAADAGPAAVPAAAIDRRTVEMTGVGTVSAVPDEVGFGVSVGLTRADLSTALDDASTTMTKVLARLADFGVVKDRVQTTGLAMEPVYDYPNYGPPVLRGYRVTQRAQVTVPELERAGGAITAAVRTGGNAVRVGDIRLLVGDRAKVLEEPGTPPWRRRPPRPSSTPRRPGRVWVTCSASVRWPPAARGRRTRWPMSRCARQMPRRCRSRRGRTT